MRPKLTRHLHDCMPKLAVRGPVRRLAIVLGDQLDFEVSRARAGEWLKPTENSSLLRYLDQLSDNWSEATGELAELPSSTSSEIVTKVAGRRNSR